VRPRACAGGPDKRELHDFPLPHGNSVLFFLRLHLLGGILPAEWGSLEPNLGSPLLFRAGVGAARGPFRIGAYRGKGRVNMLGHVARAALISAAVSFAYVTTASAVNTLSGIDAQVDSSWTKFGNSWTQTTSSTDAIGPNNEVYRNNTGFQGSAFTQGPGGPVTGPAGTNVQTLHLAADDLTLDPAATVGDKIVRFTFSIANLNAAARSVRPHVSFYLNDGPSGGPGTEVAAFLFNPISINSLTVSNLFFNVPLANQWTIPANRTFWAAETLDNSGGATASSAELDNFGQGLYNPPTIGSSADLIFFSTNPDDGFTNAPAGTTGTINGAVANFGWELRVAPEPGCLALIGAAGTCLLLRRRRA
jgi:hypothetical protein